MVYLPIIHFPNLPFIAVFFSDKNLCDGIFDTGIFTSLQKANILIVPFFHMKSQVFF